MLLTPNVISFDHGRVVLRRCNQTPAERQAVNRLLFFLLQVAAPLAIAVGMAQLAQDKWRAFFATFFFVGMVFIGSAVITLVVRAASRRLDMSAYQRIGALMLANASVFVVLEFVRFDGVDFLPALLIAVWSLPAILIQETSDWRVEMHWCIHQPSLRRVRSNARAYTSIAYTSIACVVVLFRYGGPSEAVAHGPPLRRLPLVFSQPLRVAVF